MNQPQPPKIVVARPREEGDDPRMRLVAQHTGHELTAMLVPPLPTKRDLDALRAAIDEAEQWKGNLMPEQYAEFDLKIEKMRDALGRVIFLVRALRKP